MEDASPPKWHLAHTTWFFETFVLRAFDAGYRPYHERFEYLFNSYYNGVGRPYPRPRRGVLSRPTVSEIYTYRKHVDDAMGALLNAPDEAIQDRITLGLHHEQQHQELLVTDLKYNLGNNPLLPAYREDLQGASESPGRCLPMSFVEHQGGLAEVGSFEGFCFDNEMPRHQVLLQPFALADRLVTNGEYLEFIDEGGYRNPDLWLSDGWAAISSATGEVGAHGQHPVEARLAPLYWYRDGDAWCEYRLSGAARLDLHAPVVHVSYYEADAFARWRECRLPTEQEWEVAASGIPVAGNLANADVLHPLPAQREMPHGASDTETPDALAQLFGDVWEWTSSPYVAYPGFRTLDGALGEYNGKFMSNQMVLRGGSCATPPGHVRPSYRNFFYPGDKWQFSGIRLARDL